MKLFILCSFVLTLGLAAQAEETHTSGSVTTEAGRKTNTFGEYDALATKMESWSKSMADGAKKESVEEDILKVSPSKANFKKAAELMKSIKEYRARMADACEISDPSSKDLGNFMDSCLSDGMFSQAIETASKAEDRFEMTFSMKRLSECKAHINTYFVEKDRSMNDVDKERYKKDWEIKKKFNEFFDLFAPEAGLAKIDTANSKLVEALKKVTQSNWCQVDSGRIEKKTGGIADKGTADTTSGTETAEKSKELEGTLGKAGSTKDAGYGKKAGEAVGTYGNCSTGNCGGGYKSNGEYAQGSDYGAGYGGGGYGPGGYGGAGYGGGAYGKNCTSGKCDYNYDPGQYGNGYRREDYRYEPRDYDGDGGGYGGMIPYLPKRDYDKPNYAQPAPYIPPPPFVDEPRNNPPPYYPPRYVPPPPPPIMPFFPMPPPPPPIIPRATFRLIETETRRPYIIPGQCPTIGTPCTPSEPNLLPPWMIPGINPLGNPGMPGQWPRTGMPQIPGLPTIPGVPGTITPGMPGGPITIPRTGNPTNPPTWPPTIPPTINPTWPPTTPGTPTTPTIPGLPTIPPVVNPTWPTTPTTPGNPPTLPTLPTLPGGSTTPNVNNTGSNGTVTQVPRGAR